MTHDQWFVFAVASAITALPWVLFIIAKMTMKDEPEND